MEDQQLPPVEDALKHIVACIDKPFLEERYIDTFKGKFVQTSLIISVILMFLNTEGYK